MKNGKKQKVMVIIIAAVLALAGVGFYFYQFYGDTGLIRRCPDRIVRNYISGSPETSLRFGGQRQSTEAYDMDWIESRCGVKVEKVY